MRRSRTRADSLNAQQRRGFVVGLRRAGMTYRAIFEAAKRHFGTQLPRSYCPRHVYHDVVSAMQALQEETDETARVVRTLELERLDTMQVAVWPRAVRGDLDAIGAVLKIMAHRMRLLNLDAPQKFAPTIPEGHQPAATPPWDETSATATLTMLIAAYGSGQASPDPCVAL